ncbi:MAG TPA: hypothetical protein VHZ78_08760 [Rhizomicrobium sp.]|jgi:hypothetical protein|nr:hypothetical protein [Rhizomicrobium sp.]
MGAAAFQSGKFSNGLPRRAPATLTEQARGTFVGLGARKSSVENAKETSLPPITNNELIRETQLIVLEFGTERAAEEQGSTPRAIESQKNGESAIQTVRLINWARRNARVRAHVARLIGLTGPMTDPEFMEGMSQVADFFTRQQQASDCAEHHAGEACDDAMTELFGGAR